MLVFLQINRLLVYKGYVTIPTTTVHRLPPDKQRAVCAQEHVVPSNEQLLDGISTHSLTLVHKVDGRLTNSSSIITTA